MSHHDCFGELIFRICKKNQIDGSSWFMLLMCITTHGSENVHLVGCSYICILRCTVHKTCIFLVFFTYVYHDTQFRKRASCWFFLHMYITVHGSENVHLVGSSYICTSRYTVQKTCIFLILLTYVHHDARLRKRASSWFFLHMYITMHASENVHLVGSSYIRISRYTVQKTCNLLAVLTYVYHDARFRKLKASF